MKRMKLIATAALLVSLSLGTVSAQEKCMFSEAGYTSLFNGKDLTGWKIPDGDNGHWNKDLWTVQEFEDFFLHIEWRFKGYGDHLFPLPTILPDGNYVKDENGKTIEPLGPNSDSGILLKGAGQTNLWCWSVGSGELWGVRTNEELPAGVRAAAVPSENADRPVGQWNAFDIMVKGDRITVVNNGIEVIHNALFPGLDRKGPIGLQHHGGINRETGKLQGASSLVQFRNIWIKPL